MPHEASVQPEASTVSTGFGLRYIGTKPQFCYAYSEMHQVTTGDVLHLDFTSGSGFINAIFTGVGAVLPASAALGSVTIYTIKLNGLTIATLKVDTLQEDMPTYAPWPFIIPPFTRVVISAIAEHSTTDMKTSCQITGRVYGAV